MDILTRNSSQSVKSEILKHFNVDMVNSLHANDRITFVYFCAVLSAKTSKRYFADTFLDSYLTILQSERYQGVLVALLKTAKDFRLRMDDPVHLQKLETFINSQKSDKNRSNFLKEASYFHSLIDIYS